MLWLLPAAAVTCLVGYLSVVAVSVGAKGSLSGSLRVSLMADGSEHVVTHLSVRVIFGKRLLRCMYVFNGGGCFVTAGL